MEQGGNSRTSFGVKSGNPGFTIFSSAILSFYWISHETATICDNNRRSWNGKLQTGYPTATMLHRSSDKSSAFFSRNAVPTPFLPRPYLFVYFISASFS